jgi:hypothetical protein
MRNARRTRREEATTLGCIKKSTIKLVDDPS